LVKPSTSDQTDVRDARSDHHEGGCAMCSLEQTLNAAFLKQEAQLVFQTSLDRKEATPLTDIYTATRGMVEAEFSWMSGKMSVQEVFMRTVRLVNHRPALDFSLTHLVNLARTKVNPLCYPSKIIILRRWRRLYSCISPSTKSLLPHRFHGVRSGFEPLSTLASATHVGARY
jgi:hypothetical protein